MYVKAPERVMYSTGRRRRKQEGPEGPGTLT